MKGNPEASSNANEPYSPPTFPEFIKFILATGRENPFSMDEHWRPMYLDCPPCINSFNLILKVETMDKDKELVFKILGFKNGTKEYKEIVDVWNRWGNRHVISTAAGQKETSMSSAMMVWNTTAKYYSQISQDDLKSLYNLYELDFVLFNYSGKEYFQLGSQYQAEKDASRSDEQDKGLVFD